MQKFDLEIIIPVRVHRGRQEIIDRITRFAAESRLPDAVSLIVVDDGSDPECQDDMQARFSGSKIRMLSTGRDASEIFSLACARNLGAQAARASYLMFLDADLMVYPGFFEDIFREIRILGMERDAHQFLMCPVIYLTDEGYAHWEKRAPSERRQFFVSEMLKGGGSLIEKFSSGTSAILLRRDYFLTRGGYDERFSGWGYEDYELSCRLIRRARQFPLPPNWGLMSGNFMSISRFEGWKSVYRLHGDWLAQKGIWLFHAPHRVDKAFHQSENRNWELLKRRLKEDEKGVGEPSPLADPGAGTSLFLARNPFCYTREIAPFFGRAVFADAADFADTKALADAIQREGADRVVFPNPYRNPQTLAAYRWCRENEVAHVVCERGALPDSIFHDPDGFLVDSQSYHPDKWDGPLTDEQRQATLDYIESIRADGRGLERQAGRIGAVVLRKKLGINAGKKILLIPFQQPHDTVVRHFVGPVASFKCFHALASALSQQLGESWQIVYKKHLVEEDLAPVTSAIKADDYNIYDLVEMCDAMLTMNSGTGLYGMIFDKPVHIVGDAWYADPRMNCSVKHLEGLKKSILRGFVPDREIILRFIHYLRFKFYSFGEQMQCRARYDDNSPITSTTDISYYEIRGLAKAPVYYRRHKPTIAHSSPLFDRYHGEKLDVSERSKNQYSVSAAKRLLKVNKLLRNPYAFFRDTRNPLLRPIRHLFRFRFPGPY